MREIEKYYYDPFNMDSHEISKVNFEMTIEFDESSVNDEEEA